MALVKGKGIKLFYSGIEVFTEGLDGSVQLRGRSAKSIFYLIRKQDSVYISFCLLYASVKKKPEPSIRN